MTSKIDGSKVLEAVLIAGLSALATGLAKLVVDRLEKKKQKKKPPRRT